MKGPTALLTVLCALNLLDYAGSAALAVVGPDVQRDLGLSDTALGVVASLAALTFVLGAVPVGHLGDRLPRTRLTAACAVVAALATAATGAATAVWQLAAARLLTGAGQASILPVNNALLADAYPLRDRPRVYALHSLMPSLGYVVGPLLAGAATAAGSWRTAFLVLGALSLVPALAALRLGEPPRGRGELADLVGEDEADRLLADAEPELPVAFAPAVARLLAVRTVALLLLSVGVMGLAVVSVPTYFGLLLERRYDLGALERGWAVALVQAFALVGVVLGGVLGGRAAQRSAGDPLRLVALSSAAFAVLLPLALFLPGGLPVLLLGAGLASTAHAVGTSPTYVHLAAVVPPRLRSLGFALFGLALLLLGGLVGTVVAGLVSDAHGPRAALVVVTVPSGLLAAVVTAYAARFAEGDLALASGEVEGDRLARTEALTGGPQPRLSVRGLDAGYPGNPVLHGVDLEVAEGEVLALLGTNGAGKSTLLRALSGLLVPTRGTVRLEGRDITLVDAPARVRLGIVQLAGGKAVFPSMTVAENLLAGAHLLGWRPREVQARIDEVVGVLPQLAEHYDQRAGLLSGGEQQLLAMGKALLLRPRVLLVDELSLGLAPVVVAQLLDVVRGLAAEGTSVVLVEQSLNVAVTVADRAVFLEKGTVRYDGPTADLLARGDLARAVFLGAAR